MADPDFLFRIHAADDTYLGTGVLVSPSHILTCEHVIRQQRDLTVRCGSSEKLNVSEIHPSPDQDLAILSIPPVPRTPRDWQQRIGPNTTVHLHGFPSIKKGGGTLPGPYTHIPDTAHPQQTGAWTDTLHVNSGARDGMSGGVATETVGVEVCCVGLIRLGGETAHRTILIGPAPIAAFLAGHGLLLPGCPEFVPLTQTDHDAQFREEYRRRTRAENSQIEIQAFQRTDAKASAFAISDIYIPLRDRNDEDLDEVLRKGNALVVEGVAGSGKSTFLRHTAWKWAGEDGRFPVLIKVVELDRTIGKLLNQPGTPSSPKDHRWLAIHAAGDRWLQDEAFFDRQFRRQGSAVLLDGFDELPDDENRRRLAGVVASARKQYPDCHFVLTSRPGVYEGDRRVKGFEPKSLAPLTPELRGAFFGKWSQCAYPESPDKAEKLRASLESQVEGNPNVQELADSPMMLTALAGIHWNGKTLPEDRGQLYDSIIGWMVASRPRDGRVGEQVFREWLQALAFGMQTRIGGRLKQADRDQAKEILCALAGLGPRAANDFLKREKLDSGIIVGKGNDLIEFRHLTFQEYLAGVELLENRLEKDQLVLLSDPRHYAEEWREFLSLFGIQAGKRKAQWIYQTLLEAAHHESLANRARTISLIRGMVRHRREDERNITSPLYLEFVRSMSGLFEGLADGDNLDLFARADAAEAWELLVGDTSRLLLPSDHDYWEAIADGQGIGRRGTCQAL